MTHEELEEAVPLYAIGALERSERQAIEAHLLSGAACHAALKDYQTVASLLPFRAHSRDAPNTLKAKIMMAPASTSGQPETEQPSPRSSLEPGEWMNHLFPPITRLPARCPSGSPWDSPPWLWWWEGYVAWLSYTQTAQRSGEIQQLQAAVQQGPREWPRYKQNSSNVTKRSAPSSPNWVNALPKWLNCAISYYNGKRSWTTRMHS